MTMTKEMKVNSGSFPIPSATQETLTAKSTEVASLFVRFLDYSVMSGHSACIDEIVYK